MRKHKRCLELSGLRYGSSCRTHLRDPGSTFTWHLVAPADVNLVSQRGRLFALVIHDRHHAWHTYDVDDVVGQFSRIVCCGMTFMSDQHEWKPTITLLDQRDLPARLSPPLSTNNNSVS